VLAHQCTWDDRSLVAIHNLAPTSCTVALDLDDAYASYQLVDLLQDADPTPVDDRARTELTLDGYGYRWLRLVSPDSRRIT
jgi:hypothetical protein